MADLQKYVGTCMHLMLSEKNESYTLLKEYEDLFDRTLGRWTGKPETILWLTVPSTQGV